TMSIARSTPAQKPRGPARRISEIGAFMSLTLSRLDQHFERLASGHEIERAPDLLEPHPVCGQFVRRARARLQRLHRPADRSGRVMNRAEERELLVVGPPRVQADRSSGSAATKEYHGATAPYRVHGLFPHLGTAGGLDDHLGSARGRQAADLLDHSAGGA